MWREEEEMREAGRRGEAAEGKEREGRELCDERKRKKKRKNIQMR